MGEAGDDPMLVLTFLKSSSNRFLISASFSAKNFLKLASGLASQKMMMKKKQRNALDASGDFFGGPARRVRVVAVDDLQ
jgi:hypothetical protein